MSWQESLDRHSHFYYNQVKDRLTCNGCDWAYYWKDIPDVSTIRDRANKHTFKAAKQELDALVLGLEDLT